MTLIPESDWKLFCLEWEAIEEKGISAEILRIINKVVGSGEGIPMSEDNLNSSNDEASSELESKDLIIKTDPEVRTRRYIIYKLTFAKCQLAIFSL